MARTHEDELRIRTAIARAARVGLWLGAAAALLWAVLDPPAGPDVNRWTGALLVGSVIGVAAMGVCLAPTFLRYLRLY